MSATPMNINNRVPAFLFAAPPVEYPSAALSGLEIIDKAIQRCIGDLEQLHKYFTDRAKIERTYARELAALSVTPPAAVAQTVLGKLATIGSLASLGSGMRRTSTSHERTIESRTLRDNDASVGAEAAQEESSQQKTIATLTSVTSAQSQHHSTTYDTCMQILTSLAAVLDYHRKVSGEKRVRVDETWVELKNFAARKDSLQAEYEIACKEIGVLKKDVDTVEKSKADEQTTADERMRILQDLRTNILFKDVTYPLLGTYKDCVLGQDILETLTLVSPSSFPSSSHEATIEFAKLLQTDGYIKPISKIPKFNASGYYQFTDVASESPDAKAKRTHTALKRSILKCEQARQAFCIALVDYLLSSRRVYIECTNTLKSSLSSFASTCTINDEMNVALETLDPIHEWTMFEETYKTGSFLPSPFVVDDESAIFGVDIERICKSSLAKVPKLVRTILSIIEREMGSGEDELKKQVWMDLWIKSPINLKVVYMVKNELEGSLQAQIQTPTSSPTTHSQSQSQLMNKQHVASVLRQYPPPVLVSILRIYLTELPDSLIPSDNYDSLKVLYLSKSEDEDTRGRINSLKSVVDNFDKASCETLNVLLSHWRRNGDNVEFFAQLASVFGPILLRPLSTTSPTIHDKHPQRVLKDFLLYYDDIFANQGGITALSDLDLVSPISLDGDEYFGGSWNDSPIVFVEQESDGDVGNVILLKD